MVNDIFGTNVVLTTNYMHSINGQCYMEIKHQFII